MCNNVKSWTDDDDADDDDNDYDDNNDDYDNDDNDDDELHQNHVFKWALQTILLVINFTIPWFIVDQPPL